MDDQQFDLGILSAQMIHDLFCQRKALDWYVWAGREQQIFFGEIQAQRDSTLFAVPRPNELEVDFVRDAVNVFFSFEPVCHFSALDNDAVHLMAQQASREDCQPAEQGLFPSRVHCPQKVIAAIADDHRQFPLSASNDAYIAVMRVYQINRAGRQAPAQFQHRLGIT